jgi:hypothetical protein
MLEGSGYAAQGDPARMAAAMIDSVDRTPAPLRLVLGSDSQSRIVQSLEQRLAEVQAQVDTAKLTDF